MASGNKLVFANAEKARDAIVESQKKEIASLYQKWADEIGERANYYAHKSTASSVVSERQMQELKNQLRQTSQQVSNEVYGKVKESMYMVADAVVKDNVEWLKQFGFSEEGLNAALSSVPDQIVRRIVTGQIYEGGWNLSSRIWSNNEATLKKAYEIVAKGVAENRPIYDIAKELQGYVQPDAAKPWNPLIRMKNTKTGEYEWKRIYRGKVDYNAQRLARTLVQHSYQQSFIAVTEKNPFVLKYVWYANGSRPCPLCQDRDGQEFEKGDLPMDHPNGMCTMAPVIDDNMLDKLADWFNSPDGTYPDIDQFAGQFGYKPMSSSYKSFGDTAKIKTEVIGKVDFGNVHKPGRVVEYSVEYNGNGADVIDFFSKNSNYKQLIGGMSPEEQKAFKNMWSKGKLMQGQQYNGFGNMKPAEQKATKIFDKYLDQSTLNANVQVVRLSDAQLVLGSGNGSASMELLEAMKGQQITCGANMSFAAASEGLRVNATGEAPTVEYILKVPQGSNGAGMFIGDDTINIWGNRQREFMTNRDIWMTVGETTYDESRKVYKVELEYGGLMDHDYGKKK